MMFDEIVREATAEWEGLQRGDKPLILVGSETCGRAAGDTDSVRLTGNDEEGRGRAMANGDGRFNTGPDGKRNRIF